MEEKICDATYRKLLMLDQLKCESDCAHELLENYHNYKYLIAGPSKCGKTSLLFEYAFQAVDNGFNVLYITQNQIAKLPHLCDDRVRPVSSKLKNIDIVYPKNYQECIQFLDTVHLRGNKVYQLVIMDNFHSFIAKGHKDVIQHTSKLVAMLVDTLAHFSKETG